MPIMRPGASLDEIVKALTASSQELWGEARTRANEQAIKNTAQQLHEVGQRLPQRDVEPGFYQ